MSGLEAFAVLGVAGNIVQFLEVAQRGVAFARELYRNGSLSENSVVEERTRYSLETFKILGQNSQNSRMTDNDRVMLAGCEKLAQDLIELLESLKPDSQKNKFVQAASKSMKTVLLRPKIKDLEKRLQTLRNAICHRLDVILQ